MTSQKPMGDIQQRRGAVKPTKIATLVLTMVRAVDQSATASFLKRMQLANLRRRDAGRDHIFALQSDGRLVPWPKMWSLGIG